MGGGTNDNNAKPALPKVEVIVKAELGNKSPHLNFPGWDGTRGLKFGTQT